jgi:2-oxoglutarate ferredoxin oxidoreductase subunit beta
MGNPLKITELIANLPGAYYVTRQAVHTPNAVRKLAKAFKNAFDYQKLKRGTCFIEVVSNCPSGWKMSPVQSIDWIEKNMLPLYPLGDIKVPDPKTGDSVMVKHN